MKNISLIAVCMLIICACGNNSSKKKVVTADGIVELQSVNIKDSLQNIEGLGNIEEFIYKGPKPASAAPQEHYSLKLYRQTYADDGVFDFEQTFLDAEDGLNQTYHIFGTWGTETGYPQDTTATLYKLEPYAGGDIMIFLVDGDKLHMIDLEQNDSAVKHTYTLIME